VLKLLSSFFTATFISVLISVMNIRLPVAVLVQKI